jgi:DNA (cytosine-5)-methyltransferase 1
VGGIELGFDRAGGFTTKWYVECEPYAQEILRKRFPDAIIYEDVTKIDFRSVPKVDVLTGGFPCQDISNAGRRVGIEGSRSSLWKYYLEAIRVLRPKYALIENVSALLNRGLDVVLSDLAEIGYDAEWHCVSASCVGAPHRRDRVFVIGIRTSNVAYSECERESSSVGSPRVERRCTEYSCAQLARASTDVADSCCEGLQGTDCKTGYASRLGWWGFEPDVGRVADGVSFRMDRIKCLVNAVVPQCAEIFAKAIKEEESNKG